MKLNRAGIRPIVNELHRTIPESLILDMLLLYGWVYELAAGRRAAAARQCEAALKDLVRNGLGFRAAGAARRFDPVEVHNLIVAEGLAGRCPIWTDHFIPTGRALHSELARLADRNEAPRLAVRFSRTLMIPTRQERLRLTLPVPIACAYLQDVAINIAPLPVQAQIDLRQNCIDIRLDAPPRESLTIEAEFAFTAPRERPDAETLTPRDRLLYLRPSEHLIRVTPRVARLAAALAAEALTPQARIAAFWNFMLDHLMLGRIRYSDIPPHEPGDWVLANGWCDCLLGACLFIALCRAANIPARLVGGHLLYRLLPTNHYWAECWVEDQGWLPFDFLAWDLSEAGRAPAWRDVLAGRCDPRLVTEILPLRFTGPMSVRLPAAWHMLQTRQGEGVACSYFDALNGGLLYRDSIAFTSAS